MAGVKRFSDFNNIPGPITGTGFLVGYDSSGPDNVRFGLAQLRETFSNPTDTYVPFNNAGSLGDSYIVNDSSLQLVKTVHSGNTIGVSCDFINNEFLFGDAFAVSGSNVSVSLYASPGGGSVSISAGSTYFSCEESTDSCYIGGTAGYLKFFNGTGFNFNDGSFDNGISLTYNSTITDIGEVKLGDYGNYNGGTYFAVDVPSKIIKTGFNAGDYGLHLLFGTQRVYSFKDNGTDVGIKVDIDNSAVALGFPGDYSIDFSGGSVIMFTKVPQDPALYVNTVTYDITIGDPGGYSNNTYISLYDSSLTVEVAARNEIRLRSDSPIVFDDNGTNGMISPSSGGNSGDHLIITLNGAQYKIALLNP